MVCHPERSEGSHSSMQVLSKTNFKTLINKSFIIYDLLEVFIPGRRTILHDNLYDNHISKKLALIIEIRKLNKETSPYEGFSNCFL
jgi:hypothetical protein